MPLTLRRIPLQAKLLLIAIVPIIFIAFLSIRLYNEKTRNLNLMKVHLERIEQSAKVITLIDEMQKERRFSFDYALNKTSLAEMQAQRMATDSALQKLLTNHDSLLINFPQYTFLINLDTTRQLLDRGRLPHNQVMHFYSSSIFRLNTLNSLPSSLTKSLSDVYADLQLQKVLSEIITYQGIINSNIYNALYTKEYMVETLAGTYPSYDVYKTYQNEFEVKSSTRRSNVYNRVVSNSAYRNVNEYLNKLFTTFSFDSSYSPQQWLALSDQSQNHLRGIQFNIMNNVESRINEYYNEELASRTRAVIYVILITAFIIFIVSYILALINRSLVNLKNAALKIAEGKTDIELKRETNDAIGSLAVSIKMLDEKHKEIALAANEIGKGNFVADVKPRSEHDILGNSLLQMKENLLRFTKDLEKSREEFKQLADFMPQIVWTANPEGQIDYYNKKWYELTGAKPGFGEQSWIPVIHPEDVGLSLTTWYSSVETGDPYELEYRIKDVITGKYRWFLARALPIKDENGKILKWFGTGTDIHDQKMVNEKLEELVSMRTLELKRSNEDLQQFAHVASHDLKEPVRKLRTFSDRLEMEYGHTIPDKGKTYLEKLKSSSERMSKMIDSILSYSVINATEDKSELIDLNLVVENIIVDLELVIMQKDAKVVYKDLPKISAIPTLIHQLFYNLINNALKFSKADTPPLIEITARSPKPEEIQRLNGIGKAEKYVEITIRDNGIGFEQQYADQLFNVFTRLNSREKFEGTGLGLALCKKIVHRHHGIITAQSKQGEGATFRIVLPQ